MDVSELRDTVRADRRSAAAWAPRALGAETVERGSLLRELSREERLLLLKFVCSFTWADHQVRPEERAFVSRLVQRLQLEGDERRQVEAWLVEPPPPESIDPSLVPPEHRMKFLRAVESVIAVDGEVAAAERERLLSFAKLLR